MEAIELESDRLIYLPVTIQHLSSTYVDWLNDPEVIQFLESGGNYTYNDLKDYLENVEKKKLLFWGIHLKDTGKHIGNIKIDPINHRHGWGEYGILMGDKSEWKKGYAKEASKKIISYCFDELGLRKITLGVVKDNIAAVELYKNLEFSVEGVYKDHGWYNNKLCDMIRMAIFNQNHPSYVG